MGDFIGFLLVVAVAIWVTWFLYSGFREGRGKKPARKNQKALERSANRTPTLRITYTDSEGATTQRDISPYKRATNERFRAWCHLRGEPREFLFDRIQNGIDLLTGEVLTQAGVYRAIHPTRTPPPNLDD